MILAYRLDLTITGRTWLRHGVLLVFCLLSESVAEQYFSEAAEALKNTRTWSIDCTVGLSPPWTQSTRPSTTAASAK